MATQLTLYNGALLELGEASLASLSEDREPRHALDAVYTAALVHAMEQGLWNWALRDAVITEDATDPAFGYSYRFAVPSDWVRLASISLSPNYKPPLTDYVEQAGYWQANGTPLYVKYVSDDATTYGLKLAAWPETFVLYFEAYLAMRICLRVTGSATKLEELKTEVKKRKLNALTKDAMNESVRFKPTGSWVNSRGGGSGRSHWNGSFS